MSKRPTFFYSPGVDTTSGDVPTRLVLTMDREDAIDLIRRLFCEIEGDDIVQIDLGVGRGDWTDPRVGFGGVSLRFPRVRRCPGSGRALVAAGWERDGTVSLCSVCRHELQGPMSMPPGSLAPEHRAAVAVA